MANEPLIRCEGVVKIYKVANLEVFALQGLDLQVQRGELLGVVGASGSGKSTLMNILGGLDLPSAGRVWVDGMDLLKLDNRQLNRYRSSKVGFVWQQGARNLVPYLTVEENVRLPITIAGRGAQVKAGAWAAELLSAVGLSARRSHRLAELSGGEQQRAAIAVSLANRPSLLLADEPTGEVDTSTAMSIFQLFRDLNQQYGLTTVIVSHDATIARQVNRVVAIRDGKTSTETVRAQTEPQKNQPEDSSSAAQPSRPVEPELEEVTLLDAAGRLQIPAEYLEQYAIQRRVHLETREDGILIRPARAERTEQAVHPAASWEGQDAAPARGWRSWFKRRSERKQP